MRTASVLALLCVCLVVCSALSATRLKPSKSHKAHRSHVRDLEEEVPAVQKNLEEDAFARLDETVNSALGDLSQLSKDFNKVQSDLEEIKQIREGMGHKSAQSLEDSTTKCSNGDCGNDESESQQPALEGDAGDLSAQADDESFLQIESQFDDMNSGPSDDDSMAPMAAARMRTMLVQQANKGKKEDEKTYVFGVTSDGSKQTFDIAEDGTTTIHPAPKPAPGTVPSNDASARDNDPTLASVPVPAAKDNVHTDANMPGTFGKGLNEKAGVNTVSEHDVVCVCKRNGAPRGADRIRCKRHPTPTPVAPTPAPVVEGIKQCANGTWPASSQDGHVKDVICIYFPATLPSPAEPNPDVPETPGSEPEYPPECYDDRNEFVVDSVKRRPVDEILLQSGAEICPCSH